MEWQQWFIIQKERFMKMWIETTNFRHIAIGVPIIDFWLRERGWEIPLWGIMGIIGIGFLFLWFGGLMWDRTHLFSYEAEFGNKRNLEFMKQLHELERIRIAIEELVEKKKFK